MYSPDKNEIATKFGWRDGFYNSLEDLFNNEASIKLLNSDNSDYLYAIIEIKDKRDRRKKTYITIYPFFFADKRRAGKYTTHFKTGWNSQEAIDILEGDGYTRVAGDT